MLIALSLAAALATPVHAQEEKTLFVSFASASATRNGFLHGQIKLRYTFDGCGGVPQLLYALVPGSAQGYEGYWYNGHMYGIQPGWRAPQTPALIADMQVSFNAQPISVAPLQNPFAGPISCSSGSQMRKLGQWSDFRKGSMTEAEALKRFDFNVGITREPMRSTEIESAIRAQIRADSLEKARVARLEQAKKDSIARAQQTKASTSPAGGSSAPGTTTGTTTAAAGATSGAVKPGSTTTQRAPMSDAEQKAQERRDADAQARAIRAQLEAQQAAQAEQTRQIEEATTQVAGMVAGVLAERRREQERKWEREIEAAERHSAYISRMSKIYAALPPRPICTPADTLPSLRLGVPASGTIIGSECRFADSSSAVRYPLRIDRKMKIEINATGSFETQTSISALYDSTNIRLFLTPDTGAYTPSKLEAELYPGTYAVNVQTRHPGESGTYTVKVEAGEMSRTTRWALGMYLGPVSGTFTGVSETPEFGNVGGLRAMAAINPAIHLQADWGTADGATYYTYYDVGARIYLGTRRQSFRPVFDILYGNREMFADKGISGSFYNGTGLTYAGGVEWFLAPQLGVELLYARVTGVLDIDEPQTGYSPTIDFNHGALRAGFMYHR